MPAIGPIIAAVAGIAGAKIASNSANKATNAQLSASQSADRVSQQSNDQAFQLQQDQQDYERWLQSATSQARQPYLDALSQALGVGGGTGYSPTNYQAPAPYQAQTYDPAKPFVAPTMEQATNDPGYQFALGQGQQGIEHAASARGNLLTGGTAKDLALFNQNAATTQYDKVYARAQGEFGEEESLRQAAYDRNSANAFNAYSLNSQNAYNAANLNNQSAYNAASLGLSAYGQRLSALGTLAGLASPGAYPGSSSHGRVGLPNNTPNYLVPNSSSGYIPSTGGVDTGESNTGKPINSIDTAPAPYLYAPQSLTRRDPVETQYETLSGLGRGSYT